MKAFPQQLVFVGEKTDGSYESLTKGMDLRDYFAEKAMQAYLSRNTNQGFDEDVMAEMAYKVASSMMKAKDE